MPGNGKGGRGGYAKLLPGPVKSKNEIKHSKEKRSFSERLYLYRNISVFQSTCLSLSIHTSLYLCIHTYENENSHNEI